MEDDTARALAECGTILACLLDPGTSIPEYRRRLFGKLGLTWRITDTNAKPRGWVDRCVSGTDMAAASHFRVHNESAHYDLKSITGCESRLYSDGTTAGLVCELRMDCGCKVEAPFCVLLEALGAVSGSCIGEKSQTTGSDDRITLTDGLGLVLVEDVENQATEQRFRLVSFEGSAFAYDFHAALCRFTRRGRQVDDARVRWLWPRGRALVDSGFRHGLIHMLRGYGYVNARGAGTLLLCRSHPLDYYRVMGICIDEGISNWRKVRSFVTIHAMGYSLPWSAFVAVLVGRVKGIYERAHHSAAGKRYLGKLCLRAAGVLGGWMQRIYECVSKSWVGKGLGFLGDAERIAQDICKWVYRPAVAASAAIFVLETELGAVGFSILCLSLSLLLLFFFCFLVLCCFFLFRF